MLRHWLRGLRHHNNVQTKLTVPKQKYFKNFSLIIFVFAPTIIALDFSLYGLVQEVIPNLPTVKRDKELLLVKRRCFDTLIMAHEKESTIDKCQQRSLF